MRASSVEEAIQEAQQAWKRGDKRAVRRWAGYALAQDADLEEAWLLLAAVSTPRASIAFLQRALQVNPNSERARRGLEWARRRLDEAPTAPGTSLSAPDSPSQSVNLPPSRGASPAPEAPRIASRAEQSRFDGFGLLKRWFSNRFVSVAFLMLFGLLSILFLTRVTPARGFLNAGSRLASPQETPHATAATLQTDGLSTPVAASPFYASSPVPEETTRFSTFVSEETAVWPTPLPTDTPDPQQPTPNYESGKLILVDISEQRMYVYEDGTLIYTFVVSTGMNGGTRVGTFSVLNKIPNAYGSTWDIWMPNWLGIYWSGHLQNGIHALPILPNGQQLWAGYLGAPVSYGCVVLGTYESQLLYDWAEVGTPVVIQY
ncbi:MAG: L,D-transpeptidase family protein [Anaerolineales bacterium]|nr:L,D-transpeptidase family protein [Anaerolineales bacterium]MCX7754007.1 L,D-transpeptidase family protein [Anaerolineales bacterium]MDW8276787.1 L,D-transpeptidase family protein [Anaerolineales bacterium]